ncbi:MAG: CRTAC1 family protein [Saprospiraceae bacterium]|nr:CRTAC1 family protein [Saprospiraceae bacterium]
MKIKISLLFLFSSILCYGQQFTRVENHILVAENVKSFACSWVDYDNDSDLDLFVGNLGELNSLYRNDGKNIFTKLDATTIGSLLADKGESFSVSWGDYNNDDLIDVFIANFNNNLSIYKQIPGHKFERVKDIEAGDIAYPTQGGSWADVDLDGDLDLFIANVSNTKNLLLINNGADNFTKASSVIINPATNSHGVAWGDYNNDHYPDLFIAENYEGVNLFYTNDKGTLKAYASPDQFDEKVVSTGASWIDYDNDGDLDLYITNSLNKRNSLYRNDGIKGFYKVEDSAIAMDEGNSMGACWGDYDNDGDLDLFVANSGTQNDHYYINNGNGGFTKVNNEVLTLDGKASRGCSCGDYDNDGDLDLYVTSGFGQDDRNLFYINNNKSNNWIKFDLEGKKSNRSAIGTKVLVTTIINGKKITQMREISSQTGAYGHNALQVHFGLGNADTVDVEIKWTSGQSQHLQHIKPNKIYKIVERE